MKDAKRGARDAQWRHGQRDVWRQWALIGVAVGLLAARAALAQDDIASPLPVGTTVDLSVATVGPIRDVAVAGQTYLVLVAAVAARADNSGSGESMLKG